MAKKQRKSTIPDEAKKKANNHLAEGEVTGHFHAAHGGGVAVLEHQGAVILDAPNGATIDHQEHKTVSIPAGEYDVDIVQEYDHFEEEARKVRD